MKNITSAKELGNRIAGKLGLTFEGETYDDLAKFVEEITPAIDEEFIWNKVSFEDFWRGFEDGSPSPFWQIIADKATLARIMAQADLKEAFGETVCYVDDFEGESEDLDALPEGEEIVADVEPLGSTVGVLERLLHFSRESGTAFSFKLYNLYPFCDHFIAKLGNAANEIVWRIEKGEITTDGQEILVFDGADGEYLLIGCWWLKFVWEEGLEKYGLRVALETADDAPASWKMRDCGLSEGLRIKYGK